jgi:hypothetical protein
MTALNKKDYDFEKKLVVPDKKAGVFKSRTVFLAVKNTVLKAKAVAFEKKTVVLKSRTVCLMHKNTVLEAKAVDFLKKTVALGGGMGEVGRK